MRRFLVFWILSLLSCVGGCLPVPPVVQAICHEAIVCAQSQCGNGVVEGGEECDDGDVSSTGSPRCTVYCTLRERDCVTPSECGNGLLELGEGCDDGNLDSGDGCSANCGDEALCGNGTLNDGEECDDGNFLPRDGCESNCAYGPDFFP